MSSRSRSVAKVMWRKGNTLSPVDLASSILQDEPGEDLRILLEADCRDGPIAKGRYSEDLVYRARVRTVDNAPARAVPVLGERLYSCGDVVMADGPDVVGRDGRN